MSLLARSRDIELFSNLTCVGSQGTQRVFLPSQQATERQQRGRIRATAVDDIETQKRKPLEASTKA